MSQCHIAYVRTCAGWFDSLSDLVFQDVGAEPAATDTDKPQDCCWIWSQVVLLGTCVIIHMIQESGSGKKSAKKTHDKKSKKAHEHATIHTSSSSCKWAQVGTDSNIS